MIALVPTDRDGVTVLDDWDGIGQRATGTGTRDLRRRRGRAPTSAAVRTARRRHRPPRCTRRGAFLQLYVTALDAGVLHSAARRRGGARRTSGRRSFAWAPTRRPADDPLLQREIGEIASAAYAAEATVLAAADALDARPRRGRRRHRPDPALAHQASLQAAPAKVVVDALALKAASQMFDVGGASAAKRQANLDRHWRNVRTLAIHNPTALQGAGDRRLPRPRHPASRQRILLR